MPRRIALTILASLVCALHAGAQPLTTAFTYQGELTSEGAPAAGPYDIRFLLFDAATGGVQDGTTLCVDNITVAAGRFAAELDFGAVFAGQQRYLEVHARADTGLPCSNSTGFVVLSPRQPLTAAPHAAYAMNAGSAVSAGTATTATNATQLGGQTAAFYQNAGNLSTGTLPGARLTGTYSSAVSLTNPSNVFVGNGAGLSGLNASNLAIGQLSTSVFPLPLFLTASANGGPLIRATNAGGEAIGIMGLASAPGGGVTTGVLGQSDSTGGRGVQGIVTAGTGLNYGGYFSSSSILGVGVHARANATTGITYGGYFDNSSTEGRAIYALAGSTTGITYAGYFHNSSAQGRAVYAKAASNTPGRNYAGYFESHSESGIAVYGKVDSTTTDLSYGGYFESYGAEGAGVYGRANGSLGSAAGGEFTSMGHSGVGAIGRATSDDGFGVGLRGESESQNGVGVQGLVTTPNGGGGAFGGFFEATGVNSVGAMGLASAPGGSNAGVMGRSDSDDGIGMLGLGSAILGTSTGGKFISDSMFGKGAVGWGRSTTLGALPYGVYGIADVATFGYAVFAEGDTGASGVKSFRIDHPMDPENKYLLHYAAESPEVLNMYSGKVTLDESGGAVVELPEYFASLNTDPRYTLTAIGAPMPMLHVAEEISEASLQAGAEAVPRGTLPRCWFRIEGGVAGARVSWEVKAVRNDLRMRLHGAPVERAKVGPEIGKYQHPEFYRLPAERSMRGGEMLATRRPTTPVSTTEDQPRR